MMKRPSMSEETAAGGVPAREALRSLNRARWELVALLVPLVVVAAGLIVALAWLMLVVYSVFADARQGGPVSFGASLAAFFAILALLLASIVSLPLISACILGMRSIFKTVLGVDPLKMDVAYSWFVGMLMLEFVALVLASLFLLGFGAESDIISISIPMVPAGLASNLVGFRLLSLRSRRLAFLVGVADGRPMRRRRVLWEAAAGVAVLAAGAVAVVSLSSTELTGAFVFLAFALPLLLPFLLLPLALMASDDYHHRRKRLGLGPDRRLAQVIMGMAAAGVLLVAAGVATVAALMPDGLLGP